MWIYKLHIRLIKYQKHNIFSYGRCNLLFQNLLIFLQNLVRHA